MNLYLITRNNEAEIDYDQYRCAVVVAKDENSARKIHPNGKWRWMKNQSKKRVEDWMDEPLR